MRGIDVLRDPLRNKGTAFTLEERERLGLAGLLPPRVETIGEQVARVLAAVRGQPSPMARFSYLSALRDENETLFFRTLIDNLEELVPIVYTPTIGQACLDWSRIYQRPRGLYITPRERGRIAAVLRAWPRRDVKIVVVTDGGRILGLGDLGANGMGIPIGKLALYVACAGVEPAACLPVTLDVGTDNASVREESHYLGRREVRLAGPAYDELIEEFVAAAQEVFPGVLVQFEDFANANAFRLLAAYRARVCAFNDDIQGTGAMGLAGLYAAQRITGARLTDQRLLFFGAGEAGVGMAELVAAAMAREGLYEGEARRRCWLFDSKGLVVNRRAGLAEHKRGFAQDRAPIDDLLEVVEAHRPTVLVGASGQTGAFTAPGAGRHGAAERPAGDLRALQPDLEGRVHRGGRLPRNRRSRDPRHRQPVRAGNARGADIRDRTGEQLVRLPRARARRPGERLVARHRRDVLRRGARARPTRSDRRISRWDGSSLRSQGCGRWRRQWRRSLPGPLTPRTSRRGRSLRTSRRTSGPACTARSTGSRRRCVPCPCERCWPSDPRRASCSRSRWPAGSRPTSRPTSWCAR